MALRQFLVAAVVATAAFAAAAQDNVVYHFDTDLAQAVKGLRNVRNHLDVDPTAKITAVAHANGVDFPLEGAKDSNGGDFAGPVSALAARGVKFEICEITLKSQPQEGTVHPGGRLHTLRRRAHRQDTGGGRRLHQALTGRHRPASRWLFRAV